MTQQELRRRLADNEDNYSELRKTMVAFANSVPPGCEALRVSKIQGSRIDYSTAPSVSEDRTVQQSACLIFLVI
jgi:hypothetical protein